MNSVTPVRDDGRHAGGRRRVVRELLLQLAGVPTIAGSTWATSTSGADRPSAASTWIVHQSPSAGTACRVTLTMTSRAFDEAFNASLIAARNSSRSRCNRSFSAAAAAASASRCRSSSCSIRSVMSIEQPDRPRDVTVVVEGDPACAADPMNRAVGPEHSMLDPVVRLRTRPLRDGAKHVLAIVGVQQRHVGVEAAVEAAGGRPNRASSRWSHTVTPVAMSQRHVPSPPASKARPKCSNRSRVCCSARRSSPTSSDDPTIATVAPGSSSIGP